MSKPPSILLIMAGLAAALMACAILFGCDAGDSLRARVSDVAHERLECVFASNQHFTVFSDGEVKFVSGMLCFTPHAEKNTVCVPQEACVRVTNATLPPAPAPSPTAVATPEPAPTAEPLAKTRKR